MCAAATHGNIFSQMPRTCQAGVKWFNLGAVLQSNDLIVSKKKLILVGGGDFCREIAWTANEAVKLAHVNTVEEDWELCGVIDDSPDAARRRLAARHFELPVLGTIHEHQPKNDEIFIPSLGSPCDKLRVCELIASRGGKFINLIHPTAHISPGARLATGIVVFARTIISVGAHVEDYVLLNFGTVVAHDATVGRSSTLSPLSAVSGNVRLGRAVFVGTHASILPNLTVGDFAIVGAGSVAVLPIPEGVTVMGVPARIICRPRVAGL
jgi:sugar O-acyltransferase (sialic acid O-acetyltransferase NeuD family)